MNNAPKVYVPGTIAKERSTQYGSIIGLSFNVDKLVAFAKEHCNSKGYLNIDLTPRKEVGQFGDTHSLSLNTFEPKSNTAFQQPAPKRTAARPAPRAATPEQTPNPGADDDIPF